MDYEICGHAAEGYEDISYDRDQRRRWANLRQLGP